MIKIAADILNLDLHNFAIGGSGFEAKTGSTFNDQLNTANTQITDKDNIKYVIIGGGRNDPTTVNENTIINTLKNAKTIFPKSEIIFIPMMYDNTYPSKDDAIKYGRMINCGFKANVITIENATTWGLYLEDEMTDIHPNDNGSQHYGEIIANIINTRNWTWKRQERYTNINKDATMTNSNTNDFIIFIDGLTVSLNIRAHMIKWSQNNIYQINGAIPYSIWTPLFGELDDGTPLKLKFDGKYISVQDVITGTGGSNVNINTHYTFNVFSHN